MKKVWVVIKDILSSKEFLSAYTTMFTNIVWAIAYPLMQLALTYISIVQEDLVFGVAIILLSKFNSKIEQELDWNLPFAKALVDQEVREAREAKAKRIRFVHIEKEGIFQIHQDDGYKCEMDEHSSVHMEYVMGTICTDNDYKVRDIQEKGVSYRLITVYL